MTKTINLVAAFLLAGAFLTGAFAPLAYPGDSAQETVLVDVTGAASTGTGSGTTSVRLWGYLKGIYVDYDSTMTDTTDITLSTVSPAGTVMTTTDTYTDGWYYPSVQYTDSTGAAVSGAYGKYPIQDYLTISAGQSSTGTITVTIYYGQ